MKLSHAALIIMLVSAFPLPGCDDSKKSDPKGDASADSDADTDSDSDADTDSDTDSDTDTDADSDTDADTDTSGATLLTTTAAQAICDTLYRCCDDGASMEIYFSSYVANDLLDSFDSQLPPAVTLAQADCPDTVRQMLDIIPLGPWVEQVQQGKVTFDAAANQTCLDELDNATCGEEARNALFDGTCFGFAAPAGGTEQRRMFARTDGPGASCATLNDGFGAALYGTCDPTVAFCCMDDGAGGCSLGAGTGTCEEVSAVGESCGMIPTVQLCATGVECNSSDTCEIPSMPSLNQGDACYAGFELLGECTNSYCDMFGSGNCEALKANGETCFGLYECASGACHYQTSQCVEQYICEDQ